MLITSDKYKAELAEYSYFIYEEFIHKVFMDSDFDIAQRHQILLYCFLHRGISTSQLSILFGDQRLKVKATYMTVKRLRDSDYLVWQNEFSKPKGKGNVSEPVYFITAAGVKYCIEIITSLFPELMPDESFTSSNYTFTLDEILEYLSKRCLSNSITYIEHYLGARDVNAYLLSHPFTNMDYKYETEVGIAESGVPASLFTRSLMGFNAYSHPIRCDALLTYPLATEEYGVQFYIELDTGTQRASILTDKIQGYFDNYINTNGFSPKASLLFCLQTKVDESRKELKKVKSTFGSRDYYYLMMLEFGCHMMSSVLPEGQGPKTVGEAIVYLKRLDDLDMLNPTAKSVYNYFVDIAAIDESTPLSELKNNFVVSRDMITKKRDSILGDLHMKAYLHRRNILFQRANSIEGLDLVFLQGFSLYTAPAYCLGNTFPYLLPDMFAFRRDLQAMFVSLDLVKRTSSLKYRLFFKITKDDDIVLKNSYFFMEERLHVIVENVTDDLGGQARIRHLLNLSSVPSSLKHSKVVCLIDNYSLDSVKKLFMTSSLGKTLLDQNGSRCKENEFEILFASYDTIKTYGSFFTFNTKGDIVYKHN